MPQKPQVAAGDGRRAQLLSIGGRGACRGRRRSIGVRQFATGVDCFGQLMGAKWEQCGSLPPASSTSDF